MVLGLSSVLNPKWFQHLEAVGLLVVVLVIIHHRDVFALYGVLGKLSLKFEWSLLLDLQLAHTNLRILADNFTPFPWHTPLFALRAQAF